MAIGRHGILQHAETFRLPTLWAVHIYRYHGEIICDGHRLEIHPGFASVFPPDVEIEYRYRGESVHLYAHFQLPVTAPTGAIPAMQDLAGDFARLNAAFEQAIGWFPTQQLRAEVRLWDILWQLAAAEPRPTHPAVAEALRLIELRLGDVIYVTGLAKTVGLSQNHLTRLFVAATGKPIATYVRDRRVERAAHLLRHSTLPVKAIAAEVGIPDLHLFNKSIRRAFGVPPRQFRLSKV